MLFGGVIHQDVDFAELLLRLLDSFSTKLFLADIPRDQQTFTALLLYQAFGLVCVLALFEIDNRNVCTCFREGNRDRAADSTIAASDECELISQFAAARMFFVLGPRLRLHFVFASRSPLLMLRRLKFLFLGHREISRAMDFPGYSLEELHSKRSIK